MSGCLAKGRDNSAFFPPPLQLSRGVLTAGHTTQTSLQFTDHMKNKINNLKIKIHLSVLSSSQGTGTELYMIH